MQARMLSGAGRTRAVTLDGSPSAFTNSPSSLLPVVTRILPGTEARKAPASFTSRTNTAGSLSADVSRCRRRQGSPVRAQADRISCETACACGCVASMTQQKEPSCICRAIAHRSSRPTCTESRGWGVITSSPYCVATQTVQGTPSASSRSAASRPSVVPPKTSTSFPLFPICLPDYFICLFDSFICLSDSFICLSRA